MYKCQSTAFEAAPTARPWELSERRSSFPLCNFAAAFRKAGLFGRPKAIPEGCISSRAAEAFRAHSDVMRFTRAPPTRALTPGAPLGDESLSRVSGEPEPGDYSGS